MMRTTTTSTTAGLRAAMLIAAGALVGCAGPGPASHQLSFELDGAGANAREVVIDPPGEQADNVESIGPVTLPWSVQRTAGYGFVRLHAAGEGALSCRIVADGAVVATATAGPDGRVECVAHVQDR